MKYETVARVTSKSLVKHTGKNWDDWIALLEKKGAHLLSHKEIAHYLKTKHRLTPWWQHIVANGYEQVIGRKQEGRNAKGLYSVAGSRTFYLKDSRAWKLLTSDEGIGIWLKPLSPLTMKAGENFETETGFFGEIRVVTKGDKIRFRLQDPEWEKPSVCVLGVHFREGEKCTIIFAHDDLPSARVKEEFRIYWKSVLDQLTAFVDK